MSIHKITIHDCFIHVQSHLIVYLLHFVLIRHVFLVLTSSRWNHVKAVGFMSSSQFGREAVLFSFFCLLLEITCWLEDEVSLTSAACERGSAVRPYLAEPRFGLECPDVTSWFGSSGRSLSALWCMQPQQLAWYYPPSPPTIGLVCLLLPCGTTTAFLYFSMFFERLMPCCQF